MTPGPGVTSLAMGDTEPSPGDTAWVLAVCGTQWSITQQVQFLSQDCDTGHEKAIKTYCKGLAGLRVSGLKTPDSGTSLHF
jgi:hypothetical protein